jgi:hypothetical protein
MAPDPASSLSRARTLSRPKPPQPRCTILRTLYLAPPRSRTQSSALPERPRQRGPSSSGTNVAQLPAYTFARGF